LLPGQISVCPGSFDSSQPRPPSPSIAARACNTARNSPPLARGRTSIRSYGPPGGWMIEPHPRADAILDVDKAMPFPGASGNRPGCARKKPRVRTINL
jgi:hypothetical protein